MHNISVIVPGPCHAMFIILLTITLVSCTGTSTQNDPLVVRIAKLQIDPVQLESYTSELKEEIETSIRVEPGVLTLYAVAHKDDPTNITILEVYADARAYQQHLQTPHFKKYKQTTSNMVKSLELVETTPIILGTKSKN